MAEDYQGQYQFNEVEDENQSIIPDSLGSLVQSLFRDASDYRSEVEEIWRDAWYAYRGEFPDSTSGAVEIAKKRGIYVNLTRRKCQEARVKLSNSIMENGKIPFSITPSRRPRFISPDIAQMPDPIQEVDRRAYNMGQTIRDVIDKSDYQNMLMKVINEMTLFGTGCAKSIVLKTLDFPVYKTVNSDPMMRQVEKIVEQELIPHVEWVSIWDVFPSPGAYSKIDMDYVIQRSYLSAQELRELAKRSGGRIDPALVEECIDKSEGQTVGTSSNDSPARDINHSHHSKKYQVLEMWHKGLGREELGDFINMEDDDSSHVPVCITVLGSRVIQAMVNPFEGRIPYDLSYWQQQEDSIWGSGIFEAIRDDQSMMNFIYGMYVEGKTMACQPMVALNPNSFDASQDDFGDVYPGKIWRMKAGEDVNQAFRPVIIPDVTNGLVDLIKIIERNTDLSSGQVPIGMGGSAAYQSKTATGMTILDQNSQKLTLSVVRSLNEMITKNISAIYHWLMADSQDVSIKGDFECKANSYRMFMSREINNQQILEFLGVVGQNPEMREYVNFSKLVHPLKMGLGLDVDGLIRSDEEMQQMRAGNQDGAMAALEGEASVDVDKHAAMSLIDEKKALSADIRKGIIQERLARIKEGSAVETDIADEMADTSVLLQEQIERYNAEQEANFAQQQGEAGLGQAEPGVPPFDQGRPQVQDTNEFVAPQAVA